VGQEQTAEIGEPRAAARLAARVGFDDGFLERVVQLIDKAPRLTIRHLHGPAGG